MVEAKLMHKLYTEEINHKINKLLKENLVHMDNHKQLKLILEEHTYAINKYCSNSLQDILKSTDVNLVSTFPVTSTYLEGVKVNFKAIKLYIDKYLWCNNLVTKVKKNIETYKKGLISEVLYVRMLTSFNRKITDRIIDDNYLFEGVPSFGRLYIIVNENHKKRVDWGASNKNKAEILARGGVPYLKADSEQYMYAGEKWLEYHDPIDFYFQWDTKWITKKLNPFVKDYKYKPSRGKLSITTRLQQVKQNRDVAMARYTRTLN